MAEPEDAARLLDVCYKLGFLPKFDTEEGLLESMRHPIASRESKMNKDNKPPSFLIEKNPSSKETPPPPTHNTIVHQQDIILFW